MEARKFSLQEAWASSTMARQWPGVKGFVILGNYSYNNSS
jgi:hypothetical protein